MIEDTLVIDAVGHAIDLRQENWNNETVCGPFSQFGYHGIHLLGVPHDEPKWGLSHEQFDAGATALPDVVESMFFRESWTDAFIYHVVPMFGMFKKGLVPLAPGLELRERHPERVRILGGISPFEPDVLDEVDRLVEEEQVDGLKLYPADLYDSDVAPLGELKQYRMDDPELIFPILERARHHGLRSVAVHKAIPLGPVPLAPFQVADLDGAFMAFPDLNIEIVHGGFAFLEETVFQLVRFPNAYVNLEATSQLLANAPKKFMRILAEMLAVGAADRILWGTGGSVGHPQPLLERFWDLTFTDEILETTGAPQLTREIKTKILGENVARLHGIDLDRLRKVVLDEDLQGDELIEPWSAAA